MTTVTLIPTHVKNTNLQVIGSVEDVIAGVIKPELKDHAFHAKDFYCGFELASPHSINSMGEAVLVNGHCYATSTDHNDHYLQLIAGERFFTSGIFLVPHTARPSFHLQPAHSNLNLSYSDFVSAIHATAQCPVLFSAILRFKHLESTFIRKAPITGENIFEHKKNYYDDNKLLFNDCYCYIVGVAANFYSDSKAILDELKVVLYQNPFDIKNELNIHTHGIILNRAIDNPTQITPKEVTQAIHLYNANTVIDTVIFGEVFSINKIIPV